ncbi:MAG: hypothetical protein V2A74_09510 [bacterium]
MTVLKPKEALEIYQAAGQLLDLWVAFQVFFLKAFTAEAITKDDEQRFLEVKSNVAKTQRTITQKVPEVLYYGGDKMQDILKQSISVTHLRNLPGTDKKSIYTLWHVVFVHLARTVGALRSVSEGYPPPGARIQTQGIKDIKRGGAKKKSLWKSPAFWIILLAILGGGAFALVQLDILAF